MVKNDRKLVSVGKIIWLILIFLLLLLCFYAIREGSNFSFKAGPLDATVRPGLSENIPIVVTGNGNAIGNDHASASVVYDGPVVQSTDREKTASAGIVVTGNANAVGNGKNSRAEVNAEISK